MYIKYQVTKQHTDLLPPFYYRTLFESDVKKKCFFVHLIQKIELRKPKKVTPTPPNPFSLIS